MKSTKFLVASAALSGLLAGSAARLAAAAVPSASARAVVGVHAGSHAIGLDDKDTGKHDCKGKNACKGQGGCKTGDNGCKGKNSCKGHGGCKTNEEPTTQKSEML